VSLASPVEDKDCKIVAIDKIAGLVGRSCIEAPCYFAVLVGRVKWID
jgi:hypothetical protein